MAYLGPKSFNTTPLTSSNLAFLNDPIENNNNNNNNMANNNKINRTVMKSLNNQSTSLSRPLMYKEPLSVVTTLNSNDESSSQDHDNNNNNKNTSSTITSSNSISSNYNDSLESSETSLISIPESHSLKTIIGLNDEDNKTMIDLHSNNDKQLLIPPSPLKHYDVVSVSSNSDINNNADNDEQSLQPLLLRKKSGELIKSSLKLNTLSRSNSMPNAKSVRFATTLEKIKFFKKSEKPNAVSDTNINFYTNINKNILHSTKTQWDFDSDDDDYNHHDNNSNDDHEDDYSDLSYLNNNSNDDDYDKFLNESNSTSKWLIKSNDCPYNPFSLNFAKLASNNDVILESVKLNSTGDSLIGFVYAKNLSFEKKIIVKLTYDNWNSFIEIDNSNYISSNHIFKYNNCSDSNNTYDKFSFIIKLDNLNSFSNILNLEFCIQYIVNCTSYWDNNHNKNYKISLIKNSKTLSSTPSLSSSLDSIKLENENKNNNNTSLLFDIEDTNIKLKDNNNFKYDSFDSLKPSTDMKSLRTSNSFGLKKIKSESSIPTLKSSFQSSSPSNFQSTYHGNKSNSFLITTSLPLLTPSNTQQPQTIKRTSKSVSASPVLNKPAGFELDTNYNHELPDYENIIKRFCFYTNPNNNSNNDYTHLDQLNSAMKSKTSMFVE